MRMAEIRKETLHANLSIIRERISRKEEKGGHPVTLIAVSKTYPVEDIKALYDAGQRDFGENYVKLLSEM